MTNIKALLYFILTFSYFMLLHWVSGQEFVRGNNLAFDIFFATLCGFIPVCYVKMNAKD